ncbi:long-chain fatty acid--CoA ligase [Bacillus sp. FJAT-49736]|uniref:AMP-dependent synthetase/ligase n=1 Tax=Bacillus sp. FJAT-49736 TaxID=2833582 RepID=UPI001BC971C5|nr:long-chain fatty acid--CoA ligase [Bacillus sp. FJAT-49736]MBS4172904.1 long-chain fatty acid--CoA ligase [Bacillus sp. FJAT-49736]
MKAHNLVEMVHRTVEKFPHNIALSHKVNGAYRGITYQSFWEKIKDVAAALVKLGIEPQDKVAILSENNPDWPVCDIAIMSIGAISVPIHSTLPADQVSFIAKNADCKLIFAQNEQQSKKLHQSLSHTIITLSPVKNVLSLDDIIDLGKQHPLTDWESRWQMIGRDDIATIIHTSGTTGIPKGAMLTHGNILSNIEGVQFWVLEAKSTDILLSHLPLSHVFERMAGQFMPLYVGASIAYAESIETVQQNLLEVKPTVLVSVPLLFEKVYAQAQKKIDAGTPLRRKIFDWAIKVGMKRYQFYSTHSFDEIFRMGELPRNIRRSWKLANKLVYQKVKKELGGRLRGLISGGGALNPEIAKFFWAVDLPVLEGYGLTETSPVICVNPMSRSKVGTVGKPLPNLDIQIGQDGEVMVKGPSVMKGYYHDEEATKKQFQDGWFLTGDIGTIDEDGYLKIIDRKKRMLILTTGKNVAPQPIENAINQSIYIQNSVLIGHNQKFVLAIVTLSYEYLIPWAQKEGMYGERELLLKQRKIQSLLKTEVQRYTAKFAHHEQPKKLIIIDKEWSVEEGELTPSLKVRLPEIEKKYKAIIDRTYQEENVEENGAVSFSLNDIERGKGS